MNIAIFTNNYLPNPYGVSTSIETFRRDFEKLGHKVCIFAPNYPGYIDTNKNVFRYPSLDIEFKIKFPIAIPYSWRIGRIIKNLDLDIIHAQHPNLLGSAARRWAKKKKIPLVFTWHTLYDHYAHFAKFIPESWVAKYMIRKAAAYANSADAVIAPTDSIIPILKSWGVKKEIIPVATGIVEEDFRNPDRSRIRKKYNVSNDEILLILITRITREKNIESLFGLLENILKEKNIKFILGGEGYLVPELKKWTEEKGIEGKVIFPGVIPRAEIKDYLAAGDIVVDASKSETQGMHISEAMYMGLPIVAVSATGTNSLVLNNGNGFLVEENEKEFSDAVRKLIEDRELREKFSEISKKIARANFMSEICAEKMLGVYEKCLSRQNH